MDQAHQLRKIVAMLKENRVISEKKKNRIVTITSGKGGVGKTTFTVNLALSLSNKGFRVLIIDGDFGLANVNIVMGIPVKYDLSHVLNHEKTVNEIITEGPQGIKFISGGHGLTELINISEEKLQNYIEQLMDLEDIADIILIDTGAGISDNILRLIFSSNEVILITTPEPTALMDAYALTKTVANVNKEGKIRLVVNMAQSIEEAENTLANFNMLTTTYLDMEVESLGYMLYDKAVSEAIRLQDPIYNSFPKSEVSKNIQKIVLKFIEQPEETKSTNNLQKFLHKLFKKAN